VRAPLALGEPAPPFSLPAADGAVRTLGSFEEPLLLVVFTSTVCPVAVAYEGRLAHLARAHAGRLAIAAIDPRLGDEEPAARRAAVLAKELPFPYLWDDTQAVARAYGAACTPDPFLFDAGRRLVYAGRIDDAWKDETKVARRDLAAAIEAALAGRPIDLDVRPATGCAIRWRDG